MKKVLSLFILMTTLFIPSVDAAVVDYKLGWFKDLDGSTIDYSITDILETDDGYLMLTDKNKVYVYDKDGNQVSEKEVDMTPASIIKVNEKNYVISYPSNYVEDDSMRISVDIGTLNMDGTITDIKNLNGISDTNNFYLTTNTISFVRGNYIYVIGRDAYLKISTDLSTTEVIGFENANDEDKENIADILYLKEQDYSLIGVHDGGIVYCYDNNFALYKDGKEAWSIEIADIINDVSITTHKENLLMSLTILTDSQLINKIVIVDEAGNISGEIAIGTFLSEKFGAHYGPSQYRLYGMTDGFIVADLYFGLGASTYNQSENLKGSSVDYNIESFILYMEGVEDEVKNEKVPETSDNVFSYIVLLLGSILGMASINCLKKQM